MNGSTKTLLACGAAALGLGVTADHADAHGYPYFTYAYIATPPPAPVGYLGFSGGTFYPPPVVYPTYNSYIGLPQYPYPVYPNYAPAVVPAVIPAKPNAPY